MVVETFFAMSATHDVVPIGFAIIEGISRNVKWVIAIGG
jgi:hypothetical protein